MAVKQNYPVDSSMNITAFVDSISKKFSEDEFEVEALIMGPAGASVLIKKDRSGIKDIVGLGLECRITMVIYEGQLSVVIDHVWTNKFLALLLGSVTCGSCTSTAIVGFIYQNSLSDKIAKTIESSL